MFETLTLFDQFSETTRFVAKSFFDTSVSGWRLFWNPKFCNDIDLTSLSVAFFETRFDFWLGQCTGNRTISAFDQSVFCHASFNTLWLTGPHLSGLCFSTLIRRWHIS